MLRSIRLPLFSALVAGALLAGACGPEDSTDMPELNGLSVDGLGAQADGGAGTDKVTVCHIPPGNPANAHSITVGAPAVRAHLKHGDTLGACGSADGGTEPTPDTGSDAGPDGIPPPSGVCLPANEACDGSVRCCSGLTCGAGNTCIPVLD